MKKAEVLSPVGDEKNFFVAIKSGADAVYMGLPKFNARMKAENISMDRLGELIKFAHLKQVKVYITLNTILKDSEIEEVICMVGKCMDMNVDAFIVQDIGLIVEIKKVYPNATLHGSTQLGVHNVHGARVAKSLGLTRVVLSREATIRDIQDIHNNVDIELEVFVQGANCVCFSGNCYLSSIKCNASGNRGECKQLCRLPYVLTDGKKTTTGYVISPRDNCMLDSIPNLIDAGVDSLKIEGRLKTSAYVSVSTNAYRRAVNAYLHSENKDDLRKSLSEQSSCVYDGIDKMNKVSDEKFDVNAYIDRLYRVFARGKYVRGYNDGNDIIDVKMNNHLGIKIGKVIAVNKFKDMYKVTMSLIEKIRSNDGLKFITNDKITSIGVGNIEYFDKKTIVYAKIAPLINSDVYLSNDSSLESEILDYSKRNIISIKCTALINRPLQLDIKCGDKSVSLSTIVCDEAISHSTTLTEIKNQLQKIDKDIFEIKSIEVVTDNVYVPVSELNRIRREGIDLIEKKLIGEYKNITVVMPSSQVLTAKNNDMPWQRIAIVDENMNLSELKEHYDTIILSPRVYSSVVVTEWLMKYQKNFSSTPLLNLPLVARVDDAPIIDEIVEKFKSKFIFIANNIYALDYLSSGAKIWAGSGLNIISNYGRSACMSLGLSKVIMSLEKWPNRLLDTYKIIGKPVLMTMTACPVKTLYKTTCADCKYVDRIRIHNTHDSYSIRRYKIYNCYFELVDKKPIGKESKNTIFDLR